MQRIPIEKIFSNRDSISKAKEAFLISKGRTLVPHGLNIREETLLIILIVSYFWFPFIVFFLFYVIIVIFPSLLSFLGGALRISFVT